MKKEILFGLKATLVVFAAYTVAMFCRGGADGFSVANITPNHSPNPSWDVHSLSLDEKKELPSILGQKFFYFGCGAQSFVFFSEDQKYVLKFFKQKRYKAPLWVRYMPVPLLFDRYRRRKIASKKQNLMRDFTSYKIAFDHLQKETGLILVQLNPGQGLKQKVTLVDRLYSQHQVDLDTLEFILQKKGELVYPALESLLAKNDISGAKKGVESLLNLLKTRCKKGIEDRDPNFGKNFAYIEGEAAQIDIGRFKLGSKTGVVKFPHIRDEFKDWLYAKDPLLLEHFEVLKALIPE